MTVNEDKLNEFIGKAIGDLGAAMSAVLVLIGDELGLYKALAKGRSAANKPPATRPATLASSGSCNGTRPSTAAILQRVSRLN